jgi:hypothetical protein
VIGERLNEWRHSTPRRALKLRRARESAVSRF